MYVYMCVNCDHAPTHVPIYIQALFVSNFLTKFRNSSASAVWPQLCSENISTCIKLYFAYYIYSCK